MSSATVLLNGIHSPSFPVTVGMRQGSVLSPTLFNIFLNDLLCELKEAQYGLRVFNTFVNSTAYADDVTLLSSTVTGLQNLINICQSYATKFRFRFGFAKSKCLIIGKGVIHNEPRWMLGNNKITVESAIDILGVTFESNHSYNAHTESRLACCRRRIYGLTSVGMCYPGLSSDVKAYLWKVIGAPTLTYGMESVNLTSKNIKLLKSGHGTIMKRVMGFSKRSRTQPLLQALSVLPVTDVIAKNTVNLYTRIFQCRSPAQELQSKFLANYMASRKVVKGTMIHRIISLGLSPANVALNNVKLPKLSQDNGATDSLKYLIYHDNFIKPNSNEHFLASLLLKAF